jgi:hypothetical protein
MTRTNAKGQPSGPGFWSRILYFLEVAGESYAESLERRVSLLERQVQQLMAADQARQPKRR